MPTHYETDDEYINKQEEIADIGDAVRSKEEAKNPENVQNFNDFIKKEKEKEKEESNNVRS